jgi:CO/xanthine dehydrogenase Mo-binding subunit
VYTHHDVPKVQYTRAGQNYPEPSNYDKRLLDEYVRYTGDEVAIIAAETERVAEEAMKLIQVNYEVYEPVTNAEQAIGHPSIIHPEGVVEKIPSGVDVENNIAAEYALAYGNLEEAFKQCTHVVEHKYYTQAQAHVMMETHRSNAHLDHNDRLVVTTSTQVPFHARRILAHALELPVSKIRVIKPRIGGGFGGKQALHTEFYTAFVTLKTGRPSMLTYSRKEAFESTYTRHPMIFDIKMGADDSGIIRAIQVRGISDTGAYGEHARTVFSAACIKVLSLYNKMDAFDFAGDVVYTNRTPGGALRGYGTTQGVFAVESCINELAHEMNMDPCLIRQLNHTKEGETHLVYKAFGSDGVKKPLKLIENNKMATCIEHGKALIGWDEKYGKTQVNGNKARGVGMAMSMQGSGIPNIDMGAAIIKLNEDGSFNLMMGATDLGTGSDTILAQIAAETLSVPLDKISVTSSDTDVTPFDVGAYASSTTYITGQAVINAAEDIRSQILREGAAALERDPSQCEYDGERVFSGDASINLNDLAMQLLYIKNQKQLVGNGSHVTEKSPPPFLAGFAEVEVDLDTGEFEVLNFVASIDGGTILNPKLALIQMEGGLVQGIGMAVYEDVKFIDGKLKTNSLLEYKIPTRMDTPKLTVDFVESYEPSGPFGGKSVGEVCINTPCPAIADAVYNATGVRIRKLPVTPEKIILGKLGYDV